MEISRNLSKQSFPTDSGRITLKNSLRDYVHLLKSPNFRLLVLKCAGFYSRVFDACKLIVYGPSGVLNRQEDCQNIGLPNPVFTVEKFSR